MKERKIKPYKQREPIKAGDWVFVGPRSEIDRSTPETTFEEGKPYQVVEAKALTSKRIPYVFLKAYPTARPFGLFQEDVVLCSDAPHLAKPEPKAPEPVYEHNGMTPTQEKAAYEVRVAANFGFGQTEEVEYTIKVPGDQVVGKSINRLQGHCIGQKLVVKADASVVGPLADNEAWIDFDLVGKVAPVLPGNNTKVDCFNPVYDDLSRRVIAAAGKSFQHEVVSIVTVKAQFKHGDVVIMKPGFYCRFDLVKRPEKEST